MAHDKQAVNFNLEINDFYNSIDEENRLKRNYAASVEFLTTWHYIDELIEEKSFILDACAGVGIYAFPLSKSHQVIARDLIPHNISEMNRIQEEGDYQLTIGQGSILDLSSYEDNSFDVVLNLGSFYHLTDVDDRQVSVKECLRVLKPGGLYFKAYINRYANYMKYHEDVKGKIALYSEYLEAGYNAENDLFYASTPEEVHHMMADYPIEHLHSVATDGLKFVYKNLVNDYDQATFDLWFENHLKSCERMSLMGYSEHCLYIGRKELI